MSRIGVVFALLLVLPGTVFAHATPVEMVPDSGANVAGTNEVSIRFSERLEHGSSRIRVTDEEGRYVNQGEARVGSDAYTLAAPISGDDGVYTVSWSVISQDDGHFTKGAYAFAIGSSTAPNVSDSSVVKLTSWQEATAIFIEFVGNSILWGLLVLLVIAIRPIQDLVQTERRLRVATYSLITFGVVAGISGAVWQLFVKGHELAALHSISFIDAADMYSRTAAGEATVFRMLALLSFGVLFWIFKSRIFTVGVSWRDGLLLACLLAFAYFRAIISHATANPFHSEISIFVNAMHLIDKDLWLGILIVLVTLALSGLHDTLRAIIPRAFSILALNLALISITASYIVWLHLRDFGNLTTTEWGEQFVKLAACAVLLVILRTYHVISLRWRPSLFARWASTTLSAELAAAGLVVFFSSLVIITSPPAHDAGMRVFTHTERGSAIRLEASPVEDVRALLTIKGEHGTPIVRIGEGEGAVLAALETRFSNGYVFPLALIQDKDISVEVIVPRKDTYDARAIFDLDAGDFTHREGHARTFNFFTLVVVLLAAGSFVWGFYLEILGRRSHAPDRLVPRTIAMIASGAVIALTLGVFLIRIASLALTNDFKVACLADNNMWHMMQPMNAGKATSKTPREGCMLSSGTYHIADAREYAYLRSLGSADVSLTTLPQRPVPGKKTKVSVVLKESDDTPAKLSIEHEKILHMIVISADMQYFAHVHVDDERALTQKEVNSSSFTIDHTFPKADDYVIAVDYLHGLVHESRQFTVKVGEGEKRDVATYQSPGRFEGYDVALDYVAPLIGDVATLKFTVSKDGKPVTSLVPYLGAAMHVAIIKNDRSEFIHTHGEVHPPGYVAPTTLQGHQHTPPPARFGPVVEAHAVFPSPGLYTIFGEFKDEAGNVVAARFTVRIE